MGGGVNGRGGKWEGVNGRGGKEAQLDVRGASPKRYEVQQGGGGYEYQTFLHT